MAGLADVVLTLLLTAQAPPAFEGAKVVEVPESRGAAAVKPGDVLLLADGRAEPGAPAWRRRIAASLGTPLPVRLLRDAGSVDLSWDLPKGTYRLADWPDPSEHFRRDHAASAADEPVQAATKGIQAALAANGRTALRLLRKARDAG